MKRSKFLIIFTTIIFMLVISLLPAFALDTTLSIVSVDLFPTHVIEYYGIGVYDDYQTAIDNTQWPTIDLPSNHRDYDNFIVFELIDASGNANLQEDYYDSLVINFSPLGVSDAEVNRLQFRFSLIGSQNEATPKIGFQIGSGAVPTSDYTISFTRESYGWIEQQPEAFYVQFYCDVLFNSDIDLTHGISLLCDYDFINPGNHEYFQIMGVDNPKVSYSSVSDYVADISSDMKVLTDLTVENNEVLNEIFDQLTATDPNLDNAISNLSGKLSDIEDIEFRNSESLMELLAAYSFYAGEVLGNTVDYIEAVQGGFFENEFFDSIWFAIWDLEIVSVVIVVTLGFALCHFYLYKIN